MGLQNIETDSNDRNTSSKSGSSTYPKSEKRYPFFAFWYEDGELCCGQNPQHVYIEYTKSSKHASWSRGITSHKIKKYWMDQFEWSVMINKVEEEFDAWLPDVARDDPERAADLITKASKAGTDDHSVSMTEKCPVCGVQNHVVHGDWERVDNRRVCRNHTVSEMIDAGLIE